MIFFSLIEVLVGLFGLQQFILGIIIFPFGIAYFLSAILLILVGIAGILGLKNSKSGKISNASLWILPLSIFIGSVGMAFRDVDYLGPFFLSGVATSLWLFINTFIFLPPPLKIALVGLLLLHFTILVFKKLNAQKVFFVIWMFLAVMFLINLGSFVTNIRSLNNAFNVEYLYNQQLSDGTKVKEKFTYIPEDKKRGYLETIEVSETHVFQFAQSRSRIFLTIAIAPTEQEAQDLFKKETTQTTYLSYPEVTRKTIDIPDGQGFIATFDENLSAFVQVHRTIFIIRDNRMPTEPPPSSDDFEYFVKAVSKSVTY